MGYPGSDLPSMTVDALAAKHLDLKEEMRLLRDEVWKVEQELNNRMLAINATELRGDNCSIRKTVKKKYGYDEALLTQAAQAALQEDKGGQWNDAFSVTWEVKRNPLKALLRLGGRTAELIQQAEAVISEQTSFEIKA